jgi:Mg-chelatase subunit ChlD
LNTIDNKGIDLMSKPTTEKIDLKKLQVSFLADTSGSMEEATRYPDMCEIGLGLAKELAAIDDDGNIHFITFGGRVTDYGELSFEELKKTLKSVELGGGTPLSKALDTSWAYCKQRLHGAEAVHSLIVVATDGEPTGDKRLVVESIQRIAADVKNKSQVAILFIQMGDDANATKFLVFLDDSIESACGGKDIVDTCKYHEVSDYTAVELIMKAFDD